MKHLQTYRSFLKESRELERMIELGLVDRAQAVRDGLEQCAAETDWPVLDWIKADGEESEVEYWRARVRVPNLFGIQSEAEAFLGDVVFAILDNGKVMMLLDDDGQQVPWRFHSTPDQLKAIEEWWEYLPIGWQAVTPRDWTQLWIDAVDLWNRQQLNK